MATSLIPVLGCTAISFLLAQTLVATARLHGRFTMDWPGSVQAIHHAPTPRVGGVGIYIGLLAWRAGWTSGEAQILDTILLAGGLAMAIGLLEDLTRSVSPAIRLVVTTGSGALACFTTGQAIATVAVPGIDGLLQIQALAIVFTALAVGGVANAVNMIDGCNGLASGATTIAMLALSAIAHQVGDNALALSALIFAAALAGFLLVNFPMGKLFLGDSGAYFAGFALAWMAVLLPARNPAVSPWASLLVCGYPSVEALYSIVRRWRRGQSASRADCGHLHSLVARHFVQRRMQGLHPRWQNSGVSVLMWGCAAFPAFLGVTFYSRTFALMSCAAATLVLYHLLYRQVARS